jgi:FHS family L-fucose permease-like MFS transporter
MIDVMDKHFQEELHLSLAQSAWVQFAHYLGYFLMALPAGWLASKFGYKGGIIAGLVMVAVGGFWFIEATKIAQFWAFLLGVCVIASGLTFLETVANPYSTVLGPKQFAATRINLAQSCNGIGWIFGPIVGSMFFYGQDSAGNSTGSQTLWIPYAAIGGFVLLLAVVFSFCKLPDIQSEDEFHLDDEPDPATHSGQHEISDAVEPVLSAPASGIIAKPAAAFSLLWLNIVVLSVAIGMIISAIVAIPSVSASLGMTENEALLYASIGLITVGTLVFFAKKSKITHHSIWSHPHFSGATLTQFFYVAAQCGIFAYFINYMTSQIPEIPRWVDETMKGWSASWQNLVNALPAFLGWFIKWVPGWLSGWFEVHKDGIFGLSNKGASNLASVGFVCFLAGRFLGAALLKKSPAHKILTIFAGAAGLCSLLVFCKLGWLSAGALFLSYFFMSIMFPTIFSLGIHGLGARAKKASSFIVMAIMGGAIMPKLMGHIGDEHGMSFAFIVPIACFVCVGCYGLFWSKLSGSDGVVGVDATKGH